MSEQLKGQLLVAVVALTGVLLTLVGSWVTLFLNQRNERRKIRADREYVAKRDALVQAGEAITRFQQYFAMLTSRDYKPAEPPAAEPSELGVALNQLHFYCSLETLSKMTKLSSILNRAVTELLRMKFDELILVQKRTVIEKEIETLKQKADHLGELITELKSSHPGSEMLERSFSERAKVLGRIVELHDDTMELLREQSHQKYASLEVFLSHQKEVAPAIRDALICARQELSFPLDGLRYKELMNEALERDTQTISSFVGHVRSTTDRLIEDHDRREAAGPLKQPPKP